ncbi:hypothetical protein Tco_0167618 [Tanacetum coccineum]
MNGLLKSLKTADIDGITEDPFIFVKKHVERYPMYDETTHWRLRKPKVLKEVVQIAKNVDTTKQVAKNQYLKKHQNPKECQCYIDAVITTERVVHVGLKGKLYQVMERKEDRTQDDPVQTQDDPLQTQDQDQDIDLTNTQVEQTQEQTKDQVPTQEQPEQVTPRRPSARILQRKLAKQLEPF